MIKIIDFYADWCAPCKKLAPILEEIHNEFPDIQIDKIDIEQNDEVAEHYNIRNIPTLLFFKDDIQVDKVIGVVSKATLVAKIQNLL